MAPTIELIDDSIINLLRATPNDLDPCQWAPHRKQAIQTIHDDLELFGLWPSYSAAAGKDPIQYLVVVMRNFEQRFHLVSDNQEDYDRRMNPHLDALRRRRSSIWDSVWNLLQPSVPYVARLWGSFSFTSLDRDRMWKLSFDAMKRLSIKDMMMEKLSVVNTAPAEREETASVTLAIRKRAYDTSLAMTIEEALSDVSLTAVDYVRRITVQLLILEMKAEWIDSKSVDAILVLPSLSSLPGARPGALSGSSSFLDLHGSASPPSDE